MNNQLGHFSFFLVACIAVGCGAPGDIPDAGSADVPVVPGPDVTMGPDVTVVPGPDVTVVPRPDVTMGPDVTAVPGPDVPAAADVATTTSGCPTQSAITFGAAARGSTASGWNDTLTSWFAQSNVACTPATMSTRFPAPFAVFSLPMPSRSDWDVVVTPDPGVDVNLIAWTQSSTDSSCYPTRGVGVVSCEYSTLMGGAGSPESVRLNSVTNPYRIVILVTTPQGGARGGFSVIVRNHS